MSTEELAQRTEVRSQSCGVDEARVFLRRAADHALGERGRLQLDHVRIEPNAAMLSELEEEWVSRVATVGW
eukprot:1957382-Prymnesium_polylepis.1